MDEIQHKMVAVNGINMHVAELGKGPTILLIHGFPEVWYTWRHQIVYLASHGYRAVAPDLRGYGDTTGVPISDPSKFTTLHVVGDLVALIDAVAAPGEEKVFVVGHDWGALMCWALSLYRPDKVKAMVNLSVPFSPRKPEFKPVDALRALYGNDYYIIRFQQVNKRQRYAAEFPADIWMEVLCKASSSLLRCMRVVSTEFEAMTYTPEVLDAYRSSHNIVSGYMIRDGNFDPPATINFYRLSGSRDILNIGGEWDTVLATTEQGLMYKETVETANFEIRSIICKPATGEFRRIPSPNPTDETAIMSLVVLRSDPIHYKLIRLSKPDDSILWAENTGVFPMEVFDSNDWGWEKHTSLQLPFGTKIKQHEAVVCGCCVYLLLSNKRVLKINATSGLCTTIFTPSIADEHDDRLRKRLVKINGRVMFWYQQRNDKWDSWMLGRTDMKWTRSAVGQVCPGRENWWDVKDGLISFYTGGQKTHTHRPRVVRTVFPFETDFELANL